MIKNIVVPLDGSELAEVALPYARELMEKLDCGVTLLCVVESSRAPYRHMQRVYMEGISQNLVQERKKGGRIPAGQAPDVETVVLSGNPAERIVEYADKRDGSLIVMATHGQSGIRQWPLGSVADKVIRATTKPVLFIRAGDAHPHAADKRLFSRVLVPLDGSREAEGVLPYVEFLASRLGTEVFLLQVVSDVSWTVYGDSYTYVPVTDTERESRGALAREYLGKAARMVSGGVTVETRVAFGAAADEIMRCAREVPADLVAMSTHGRSGFRRWVFGSVAERLLREGDTPLLLVRAPGGREK